MAGRTKNAARAGATALRLGAAVAVCFSLEVASAGAAGLADRIISAEHSRSGTTYWSFKPDGSDRRKVLHVAGGEVLVRSANGRNVLVLETERRYGLHLARVDGRRRRLLQPRFDPEPFDLPSEGVALSPDGTTLAAIVRHTPDQPAFGPVVPSPPEGFELVTFDADGGNRHVIVPLTRETPLSDLQWAPDGRHLAFTRAPFPDCGSWTGDHPDCTYTIEVIPADGSAPPRVVARTEPPRGGGIASYEISPDGRRIAFPAAGSTRLAVARLDGSNRRTLTRGPVVYPNWSPDGRRILFRAGSRSGPDVFSFRNTRVVTLATGRLARFSGQANVTAWSPDGRRLLGTDQRQRGLQLYHTDGRMARRIPGTKRDVLGGAIWEGGRRL